MTEIRVTTLDEIRRRRGELAELPEVGEYLRLSAILARQGPADPRRLIEELRDELRRADEVPWRVAYYDIADRLDAILSTPVYAIDIPQSVDVKLTDVRWGEPAGRGDALNQPIAAPRSGRDSEPDSPPTSESVSPTMDEVRRKYLTDARFHAEVEMLRRAEFVSREDVPSPLEREIQRTHSAAVMRRLNALCEAWEQVAGPGWGVDLSDFGDEYVAGFVAGAEYAENVKAVSRD